MKNMHQFVTILVSKGMDFFNNEISERDYFDHKLYFRPPNAEGTIELTMWIDHEVVQAYLIFDSKILFSPIAEKVAWKELSEEQIKVLAERYYSSYIEATRRAKVMCEPLS